MKINHVLVPLDQSALAEIALEYAITLVQGQGMLTLMTAVESPGFAERSRYAPSAPEAAVTATAALMKGVLAFDTSEYDRYSWDNASAYLERLARRLETPHLKVSTELSEGSPAEAILQAADRLKVDAIVMCTHGRSGLSRWLLGSVAQKIVGAAACPIFLVPQRAVLGT